MPAWIAGIQARRMRPDDIHVNLGSGCPCRNDELTLYDLRNSDGKIPPPSTKFSKEDTKFTEF